MLTDPYRPDTNELLATANFQSCLSTVFYDRTIDELTDMKHPQFNALRDRQRSAIRSAKEVLETATNVKALYSR